MKLSYTKLSTLLRCPQLFNLKFIQKVDYLLHPNAYLGGTCHRALEWAFKQKIDGLEVGASDIKKAFSSFWDEGTWLEDEEDKREVDWAKENSSELKEVGLMLVENYWTSVAKNVEPLDVEVEFEKDIGSFTLRGKVDLITSDGVIVDFKTSARRFSDEELKRSLQPTIYLLALGGSYFEFHLLVKAKIPYSVIQRTARSPKEISFFKDQVLPQILRMIEAGIFPPNPTSWLCSPQYCETFYFCRG